MPLPPLPSHTPHGATCGLPFCRSVTPSFTSSLRVLFVHLLRFVCVCSRALRASHAVSLWAWICTDPGRPEAWWCRMNLSCRAGGLGLCCKGGAPVVPQGLQPKGRLKCAGLRVPHPRRGPVPGPQFHGRPSARRPWMSTHTSYREEQSKDMSKILTSSRDARVPLVIRGGKRVIKSPQTRTKTRVSFSRKLTAAGQEKARKPTGLRANQALPCNPPPRQAPCAVRA